MSQLPAATLRNRTFVGLLIAQFLAAFNDQAIHASAMFFAINQKVMTDAQAISLMPILFYAPWAIFVTLAGYYADRFSKRKALVFWKVVEIGIMAVATFGFWLGAVYKQPMGPWIVLSCVFLMGMHSAFFVPAKYGAMPDILQPQLLSRGNGILESLSFLAIILGTVCGGLLSHAFHAGHREYYIGWILFGLALVGAAASLLIQPMPAANSSRPFPPYIYGPLIESLKIVLRSRPLRLAMVGIAFFTFMVAFMRATVYMLGESQNPRWTESKTSIIVGTTSLGIALGAPLAGILSGRKIELGLVPLGALGMAVAAAVGGVFIENVPGLIACIIAIGFFTGFYLVPLFSLQQHRAPKTSKGDVIATNNFVNVIGAIAASALFFAVVFVFKEMGAARPVPIQDAVSRGKLVHRQVVEGHTKRVEIEIEDGNKISLPFPGKEKTTALELNLGLPGMVDAEAQPEVVIAYYKLRGVEHYLVRLETEAPPVVFDTAHLPRYLFFGAGVMALITLGLLWLELPDLFGRMGWVFRNLHHLTRMNHMHVIGTSHVPFSGPVVLATNCRTETECRNVVSATDRAVRFVKTGLNESALTQVVRGATNGTMLALTAETLNLLPQIQARLPATVIPVYYGPTPGGGPMRIAFAAPLPANASQADLGAALDAAANLPDTETGH